MTKKGGNMNAVAEKKAKDSKEIDKVLGKDFPALKKILEGRNIRVGEIIFHGADDVFNYSIPNSLELIKNMRERGIILTFKDSKHQKSTTYHNAADIQSLNVFNREEPEDVFVLMHPGQNNRTVLIIIRCSNVEDCEKMERHLKKWMVKLKIIEKNWNKQEK